MSFLAFLRHNAPERLYFYVNIDTYKFLPFPAHKMRPTPRRRSLGITRSIRIGLLW